MQQHGIAGTISVFGSDMAGTTPSHTYLADDENIHHHARV